MEQHWIGALLITGLSGLEEMIIPTARDLKEEKQPAFFFRGG